jgi:valyl-tRNA synthetase
LFSLQDIKVYMPLADLIDTEKEISRLCKQLEAAQKELTSQEARLGSSGFRARAKPEVVAAAEAAVAEKRSLMATLQASLDKLTGTSK